MTYDEIFSEWEKDGKIDTTNPGKESANIPNLHNKYFRMYVQEGLKLRKLQADYKQLVRLKKEYYDGSIAQEDLIENNWKPNPLKILKQDLQTYIDSDTDVIKLSLKISYQESVVDYLESIVKQINNRGFHIKNLIEWERFSSGG